MRPLRICKFIPAVGCRTFEKNPKTAGGTRSFCEEQFVALCIPLPCLRARTRTPIGVNALFLNDKAIGKSHKQRTARSAPFCGQIATARRPFQPWSGVLPSIRAKARLTSVIGIRSCSRRSRPSASRSYNANSSAVSPSAVPDPTARLEPRRRIGYGKRGVTPERFRVHENRAHAPAHAPQLRKDMQTVLIEVARVKNVGPAQTRNAADRFDRGAHAADDRHVSRHLQTQSGLQIFDDADPVETRTSKDRLGQRRQFVGFQPLEYRVCVPHAHENRRQTDAPDLEQIGRRKRPAGHG